jgi:DME family drug/metabolite transporter
MDKPAAILAPSPAQGRVLIAAAAILWSTSGAFAKVLTLPTALGLNEPKIEPLQMAFFRGFFAGFAMLLTVRRGDVSFRPMMLVMMAIFALMNATFVSALALGTAANAILLQYIAPMWMFLASVCWLGERADLRNLTALLIGLVGIAVIVIGGWQEAQIFVIGLGLTSGVTYAGVIICLRVLRDASPRWLTLLNHFASAAVLIPFVWHYGLPTPAQLAVLLLYGAGQMALPYWLMARGLRFVSAQEAGTITLLEPLLNPVWAYLVSGEQPSSFTSVGGVFILAALAWRYWPRGEKTPGA